MSLDAVRRAMASALLAAAVPDRLGEIVLAAHQRAAARRLATLLVEHGGALLADDVGLGKTFTALAVATRYPRVVILHPASLRAMWSDSLRRATIDADLLSYESLSRARARGRWDLVILDEAHHARSTSARRYRRVAEVCAHAHTLLLTATPLPNRLDELRALLALFLGERAATLETTALSALIVRRPHGGVSLTALPDVGATRWIDAPADSVSLEMLRALPDPVVASDEGNGGALRLFGLVRQWASSRGALRAALRRRLAASSAIQETLAAGRVPSRAELSAWMQDEGALQLAIPGLLSAAPASDSHDLRTLATAAMRHGDAVADLLAHLRTTPDPDAARAQRLASLRQAHPGERILAFSESAETVQSYWRYLRHEPGVARLTSRGGEIASGSLSRDDVLRRFAPSGQRRRPPRDIEAITLLVTTDLLAEGVDLRDATVVVHLDLPWSPARLEQRVGRARRMGSRAPRITVYGFRPPAGAEHLLELERRLREKSALAWQTVGTGTSQDSITREPSDAERLSALLDRIATWEGAPCGRTSEPLVAELAGAMPGWLAVTTVAGRPQLVASLDGVVSDVPAQLERAIAQVESISRSRAESEGHARAAGDVSAETLTAIGLAAHWAAEREAETAAGPRSLRAGTVSRRALDRIQRAYARSSPERRGAMAPLATAAREFVSGRLTAGQASDLMGLTQDAALDDESWLTAVVALARPVVGGPGTARARAIGGSSSRVRVMICFSGSPPTAPSPASATPS